MKRLTSVFIFVLLILFASSSLAQNLPLNQKQWYGLGVEGAPPDTSNYNGIVQQIASQTGLVDAAGNVCFAAADAGCRIIVALGGALGAVSLSLMNGVDLPVANVGLNVVSGNYSWGAATGQFVAQQILETSAPNSPMNDSLQVASGMYGYDGANWDMVYSSILGDGLADSMIGMVSASVGYGYNGATLDRIRIGTGVAANAVLVTSATDDPAVTQLGNAPWGTIDDANVNQCVGITAGSVEFVLTGNAGDWYLIQALGNTAYVRCGAPGVTATTVPATGISFPVPSGGKVKERLTGPNCAVIGLTAAGFICFTRVVP